MMRLYTAGLFTSNSAFILSASSLYSYTESLFALFAFVGLEACSLDRFFAAAPWFALASATRSNGLLLALHPFIHALQSACTNASSRCYWRAVRSLAAGAVQCTVAAAPLVAFQWYGYSLFCSGEQWQESPRPWCLGPLPYVYGFIQSHYWNVGFLRYFEMKQAPNFLLAAPMIAITIAGLLHYARFDIKSFATAALW
ncbi:hypothetical protein CYMTET_25487 [Cymbomonas tetramitiformis]|uniref:GPI mannosyltransferase 2 n=1 Tax=Cymbomonas tetramitiformis TaxID=36881 RepID=A0AAE0FUF1_9CHLO|nr:hypothetical protein CYMTET_25487 [Cymbomonas tetramitiformis]